jgi:hypothetical protein
MLGVSTVVQAVVVSLDEGTFDHHQVLGRRGKHVQGIVVVMGTAWQGLISSKSEGYIQLACNLPAKW